MCQGNLPPRGGPLFCLPVSGIECWKWNLPLTCCSDSAHEVGLSLCDCLRGLSVVIVTLSLLGPMLLTKTAVSCFSTGSSSLGEGTRTLPPCVSQVYVPAHRCAGHRRHARPCLPWTGVPTQTASWNVTCFDSAIACGACSPALHPIWAGCAPLTWRSGGIQEAPEPTRTLRSCSSSPAVAWWLCPHACLGPEARGVWAGSLGSHGERALPPSPRPVAAGPPTTQLLLLPPPAQAPGCHVRCIK